MSEELNPWAQDARAAFAAWVQSKAPQERELSLFDAWQAALARQQEEIEAMKHDIAMLTMAANAEAKFADELNARLSVMRPIFEALQNLIKVKGRHHSEQAYQRLVAAVDAATGVKA